MLAGERRRNRPPLGGLENSGQTGEREITTKPIAPLAADFQDGRYRFYGVEHVDLKGHKNTVLATAGLRYPHSSPAQEVAKLAFGASIINNLLIKVLAPKIPDFS